MDKYIVDSQIERMGSMKKQVVLIGVLFLIGSFLKLSDTYAIGNRFSDVKEKDWFMEDVNVLSADSRQIIDGYPDGTFRPDLLLTAEEFITMVIRASHFNLAISQGDNWAESYIQKAKELGYVKEEDFSSYTKVITRGEMARIIERALWVIEGEQHYANLNNYSRCLEDILDIPESLRKDVYKIYGLGIITGYPDSTFRANNGLIRAEGAAVIRRLIDKNQRKRFLNVDETFREDLMLIDSDLDIVDTKKINNCDLSICIDYFKPIELQVSDVEDLLLKRYSKQNICDVIEYIKQKKGLYSILAQKEKWYLIEGDSICIYEHQQTGKNNKKRGSFITINSWYGSEMYKNKSD